MLNGLNEQRELNFYTNIMRLKAIVLLSTFKSVWPIVRTAYW
jgi:hypothetical protein